MGEGPVRLGASCRGLRSESEDRAEEVAQTRGAQEAGLGPVNSRALCSGRTDSVTAWGAV